MPFANLHAGDAKHRQTNPVCPSCGRSSLMSFEQWCVRNSFSRSTGWKIMKSGDGPKITRISGRRIVIREDHHQQWLDSRETRTTTKPYRK